MEKEAKTFYIKPLKLFSHHDTVYLHAQMANIRANDTRNQIMIPFSPCTG